MFTRFPLERTSEIRALIAALYGVVCKRCRYGVEEEVWKRALCLIALPHMYTLSHPFSP